MNILEYLSRLTRPVMALKERIKEPLAASGGSLSAAGSDILFQVEQVGGALLLTVLFGLLGRYLPFWADAAIVTGIVAIGWWRLREEMSTAVVSFALFAGFYFLLSQPTLMLGFAATSGIIAAAFTVRKTWGAKFWKVLVGALLALVAGTALSFSIFLGLYTYVVPYLHPLTVWLWNISPAASVVSTLALVAYASFRQPVGHSSNYWLIVPALAGLFVLFFFPSHSYIAAAVGVAVAVGLSIVAFLDRPKSGKTKRTHRALAAVAVCGLAFIGLFTVANRWEWFYNYQMANAIQVNRHELSEIPTTQPTRLVPRIAAADFCAQGNHSSFTDFGSDPQPKILAIQKDGQTKQYWQCLRYPTRAQGHLSTYTFGGIEGFVLTDAGNHGRYSDEIDVDFIFGDRSLYTKAAFFIRHPGSTPAQAMIGRDTSGKYALLIPYTSRSLQWGGMIPDFSGVMIVTPWGFVEDLTPGQAAARFPGVALYPSELAREYAELWAQESSIYAKHWSGNILEVSEISDGGDNRYPFWQAFSDDIHGVIPFEPAGKNQNVLAAIGLFDRSSLTMDVYYTPVPKDQDISKAGLQQDYPGPKQIVSNVALSHPGMNQIKTVEALLNVSACKEISWSTALLQTDKKQYHGYSTNVVYDSHAQEHADVESSEKLGAFVNKGDSCQTPAPAPAPAK